MSKRIPRIGILNPLKEADARDLWNALKRELEELGYAEGKDIEFIWRFADRKFERLPELAGELIAHEVDIIVPANPPAIHAAKAATTTVPISGRLGPRGDGARLQYGASRRQHYRNGEHVTAP